MEFALILPLILAFAMAVIEGGVMFYSWLTIQKAAQSGARFAATGQGDDQGTRMSQILAVTQDWMEHLDKGDKTIVIKSWPNSLPSGEGTAGDAGGPCQMVEVAVTYSYHPFTPLHGRRPTRSDQPSRIRPQTQRTLAALQLTTPPFSEVPPFHFTLQKSSLRGAFPIPMPLQTN